MDEQFTTLLRKSTRDVHNISDTLVQSKFVFGLIDDRVWAEGLLVFSNVFQFLEDCMKGLPGSNISKYRNERLMRGKYFEADLAMYYGDDWRTRHPIRESVRKYVQHLEHLQQTDPDMLIAYVYHLYLGLLSGGRILRKKQKLMTFSQFSRSMVVDFNTSTTIELKSFIKNTTNEIAETLDEDTKKRLLKESRNVFKLNCELIRSVNSANDVLRKTLRVVSHIFLVAIVIGVALYVFRPEPGADDGK